MNITSKSRYALKIMIDLAYFGAKQPLVRRNEIAARQGVPTDYLDQIMIKLRAGQLVESIRGRTGGYRLARRPEEISMWDLFSTVEENMIPVECISSGESCDFESSCSSKNAWGEIFDALKASLSQISLGSLALNWGREQEGRSVADQFGKIFPPEHSVRECRSGSRCEAGNMPLGSGDHNCPGARPHG